MWKNGNFTKYCIYKIAIRKNVQLTEWHFKDNGKLTKCQIEQKKMTTFQACQIVIQQNGKLTNWKK